MQLRITAIPVKRCKHFQPTITASRLTMEFGRVSRIKSRYLNDSVVLYSGVKNPGYLCKFIGLVIFQI